MTTLDPDKVHRIDEDIVKPALEAAAASGDYSLDDPATSRPTGSKFILTSYPTRAVQYPYVVIEMMSTSGGRIDKRETLFQYDVTIRFLVRGKTKTHCHNIINGIAEVIHEDWRDFAESGLSELKITGSSSVLWDSTTKIYTRTLTIQGLVFAK